tara:strand:- start:10029 stop:10301 length:273 start_codon:yes stop_codon:yes gene_type:complete
MKYKNQNITIDGHEVKQINKVLAEKIYNKGEPIYLHPNNMLLNNIWQNPIRLDNKYGFDFKKFVNNFEYYYCNNQRGKYTIFFKIINKHE